MKIGNNEIGFFFNVRARINIAQNTTSKRFTDISELFQGGDEEQMENVYKIAKILNHEYEVKKRQSEGKTVDLKEDYSLIKRDDIEAMDNFEYIKFQEELIAVLKGERTVECEHKKGKKQEAKPSN